MTDKFSLSVGQAHELELAFKRNGWTSSDVHYLCAGGILGDVLMYVRKKKDGHKDEVLDKTELMKEKISKIFTRSFCSGVLGFSRGSVSRFLHIVEVENNHPEGEKINTMGELLNVSKYRLLRIPNFGEKTLVLVEAVLDHYGLKLKP